MADDDHYRRNIACVSFNPHHSGRTSEVNMSSANVTVVNNRKDGENAVAAIGVGNVDVKNGSNVQIKIKQSSGEDADLRKPSPELEAELRQVLRTVPDETFNNFIKTLHTIGIYGPADFMELPPNDDSLQGLLPRIQQAKFMRYLEKIHAENETDEVNETDKVVAQADADLHTPVRYSTSDKQL